MRHLALLILAACPGKKPPVEPPCDALFVRFEGAEPIPFPLQSEPPVQQHVAQRPGCSADNGRLTSELAPGERSVGRFAIGAIESACGVTDQSVLWLKGEAPADYPFTKQGYQAIARTDTPCGDDCTCRDEPRFYPGRPPFSVNVCRPGTEAVIDSDLNAQRNVNRVVVKPGIYRGDVTLRPGVHLISEIPRAAVIIGTVTCADDATLEGFVVTGGSPGITCTSQRTRIINNVIRGNFGAGLLCDGCTAELTDNIIVGNLRAPEESWGVHVISGTPVLNNNVITRHDHNDGSVDEDLRDLRRDDFRHVGERTPWISDAAQEYIVEGFFNGVETPSGLVTGQLLVPPPALTYSASGIVDTAVELFVDAGRQTTTTVLSAGATDACTSVTIAQSPVETRGDAYPAGQCTADAVTGGVIAGGRMLLAADVLDTLDDPAVRTLVTHESGHVFGLRHVFRAVSPMAYGPQRADYAGVDAEALALRTCVSDLSFAEWRAKRYVLDHILEPFPAIERTQMIDGRLHIFGSRFTLRFGSSDDTEVQPIVHFNDIAVPVDKTLTQSWHGGVTRNLEVQIPDGFTEGWLSVEARGLYSIPVWLTR